MVISVISKGNTVVYMMSETVSITNAEAEKILNFTPTTKAVTIILGKET
jgi:hypothetical protein